jgi:cyclopropane fatty-acyl-phospholipid synthase-like methyltransferase
VHYILRRFSQIIKSQLSNSNTQKLYIDAKAEEKGFEYLRVITGNAVDYEFESESFDRVVSIEVRC